MLRICHEEAQCWFEQEYMKSNASQDPLQRDIRELSNTSEKGKVTASPKAKVKVKARARENIQEKGNHNQDQAGSPNEDGQRTLGDFGRKGQRVEFVGDVQENDDLRFPDWIEQLVCFAFRSARVWIRRNCQVRRREFLMGVRSQRALMKNLISQRERCFSPLDVEMIDQLPTLEVLCPRAQWIMRRQFRQRTSITV